MEDIDVEFSYDDEFEDYSDEGIYYLANRQEASKINSLDAHASTTTQEVSLKPRPGVSPAAILAATPAAVLAATLEATPTVAGSASLKPYSDSTSVGTDASVSSDASSNDTSPFKLNFVEVEEGTKKFTGAFTWWMILLIIMGVILLLTLLAFLVMKVRKNDADAAKGPAQTPKPAQPKDQPQAQKDAQMPIKDLGAALTKVAATPTEDIEKAINSEIQNQLKERVEKIVV